MSFSEHIGEQLSRMARFGNEKGAAVIRQVSSTALAQAQSWDGLAASHIAAPLCGLSVGVKACFDVQGWVTNAGSRVLQDQPPAIADAALVMALKRHGAIVTAQTNMTEFALGALGLNPHFGTPMTPLDPSGKRIAGGSTSGGAVAVALGLVDVALGSDTSGSVRIPAAFCGVVGFKPSRRRYSDEGMIFLSPSFDVPGFIARDAETLLRIDHALVPKDILNAQRIDLYGRRFLIPGRFAMEHADAAVSECFNAALAILESHGAHLVNIDWPELAHYGEVAVDGGIIIAEAFVLHRSHLKDRAHLYDPRVGPRIATGEHVMASAYLDAKRALVRYTADYHERLGSFDALLMPTVPIVPPTIDELDDDYSYYKTNRLSFRLTEVANRIDAPSVSLPVNPIQPIGISLTGHSGSDRELLYLSIAIQAALKTTI